MSTDIKEHETVRLTRDWVATVTFPQWFTGTVVHRHPGPDGAICAYDVEFTDGEDTGRGVLVSVPLAYVEKVDETQKLIGTMGDWYRTGDVMLTDTLGNRFTVTLAQLLADLAVQGIACLPAIVMQRLIREREPAKPGERPAGALQPGEWERAKTTARTRPHCDEHAVFRSDCEACQAVDGDFIIR